jgi:hypothetical protein
LISRRTAIAIAKAYTKRFSRADSGRDGPTVFRESLYDFLFENNFQAWFCNSVKRLNYPRELKEWAMRLHTGETFVDSTPNWDWKARAKIGQDYLKEMSKAYLNWFHTEGVNSWRGKDYESYANEVQRSLELDGYVYKNSEIMSSESDVLNVEEETEVLHSLYTSMGLARRDEAFQFLELSETHYVANRWEDCIANARKFFELTMQECADKHSIHITSAPLSMKTKERPVEIRDYLESVDLLEKKEREFVDKCYGFLSHTGSHPYMAKHDQARLLRQIALTVSQFVMLRTDGATKAHNKPIDRNRESDAS